METSNWYKIPGLKFDVNKMIESYQAIRKQKEFDNGGGKVTFISSISLTRIPGNPESTEGKYSWGRYWTKPDNSGHEVQRSEMIDEKLFSEFIPEFKNTYFKEIYDQLTKYFSLGRVRLLRKEPRSTLSWHRDPEPRIHIPIITNPGCRMVVDENAFHMPADGSAWFVNTCKYHNFFNGGEQDRIHFVATLPGFKVHSDKVIQEQLIQARAI